jgi:hypothetical protein
MPVRQSAAASPDRRRRWRGLRYRAEALALALAEKSMGHAQHLDDPKAVAHYQSALAEAAALNGNHRAEVEALSASQTPAVCSAPKIAK